LPVLAVRHGHPKAVEMRENIGRDRRMNKDEVIEKLRAHEPELKAAGIVRLAVFGSVARGDNSPESDIDLLADFDKTKRYTLLTMGRLENRLADLLGTKVDLSSPEWLKESVKHQVLREAVFAF
jgi:predicted nucleotidyltransferase